MKWSHLEELGFGRHFLVSEWNNSLSILCWLLHLLVAVPFLFIMVMALMCLYFPVESESTRFIHTQIIQIHKAMPVILFRYLLTQSEAHVATLSILPYGFWLSSLVYMKSRSFIFTVREMPQFDVSLKKNFTLQRVKVIVVDEVENRHMIFRFLSEQRPQAVRRMYSVAT